MIILLLILFLTVFWFVYFFARTYLPELIFTRFAGLQSYSSISFFFFLVILSDGFFQIFNLNKFFLNLLKIKQERYSENLPEPLQKFTSLQFFSKISVILNVTPNSYIIPYLYNFISKNRNFLHSCGSFIDSYYSRYLYLNSLNFSLMHLEHTVSPRKFYFYNYKYGSSISNGYNLYVSNIKSDNVFNFILLNNLVVSHFYTCGVKSYCVENNDVAVVLD